MYKSGCSCSDWPIVDFQGIPCADSASDRDVLPRGEAEEEAHDDDDEEIVDEIKFRAVAVAVSGIAPLTLRALYLFLLRMLLLAGTEKDSTATIAMVSERGTTKRC